jgi:phage baseplate assembly protein W
MSAGTPYWQAKQGFLGEIVTALDDLHQAIQIIVQTPLGSVPLEPEFGCALYKWLDKPAPIAAHKIIKEITTALLRWEPRIEVGPIQRMEASQGKLRIRITWRPISGGPYIKTEVAA